MHKPEFVQENKAYKILWEFQIQIPPKRPDLISITKKERT